MELFSEAGRLCDAGRALAARRVEDSNHVGVDHDAFTRGHTENGEVCDIPGIGPIPVSVARRLAGDAVLKVIVTDGVDVTALAHGGRTIPAHLRSALRTPSSRLRGPGL